MSILYKLLAACTGMCISFSALAITPVEQLLQEYQAQGASGFSADAGKAFWNHKFSSTQANPQRSCSTCHTSDPRQAGKHVKTGKEIKPLAPSVTGKRLTNITKINKWFRRNCNWTLGRDCTAQEKGNVLTYLKDL